MPHSQSSCDCCAGIERLTPVAHENRAGLPAVTFRVGTHGLFKSSMMGGLSNGEALRRLGTRKDDDLTVALIDGWATVLDVLTFYQERFANEAFLRTATERRSLLEMARLIGYELGPGVAARVLLAFTLDDKPGSPESVTIEAGTRAQSLPTSKDEQPQSFETSEELITRPAWNVLHPRRFEPQTLDVETGSLKDDDDKRELLLAGVSTSLRNGDRLLFVPTARLGDVELLKVTAVEPQPEKHRTRVTCEKAGNNTHTASDDQQDSDRPEAVEFPGPRKLARREGAWDDVVDRFRGFAPAGTVQFSLQNVGFSGKTLASKLRAALDQPPSMPTAGKLARGVYALRVTAAPFGHNAPIHASLPKDVKKAFIDWDSTTQSRNNRQLAQSAVKPGSTRDAVHLDQLFESIQRDSWFVLQKSHGEGTFDVYQVESARGESLADYAISGQTTRVELRQPGENDRLSYHSTLDFERRTTVIFTASERLELADLPIEKLPHSYLETKRIDLEDIELELEPGRHLVLRGETADDTGVKVEELQLEGNDVDLSQRQTRLRLRDPLKHTYKRDTVEIYANVVPATHGETRTETLGSGDGSEAFQAFTLRDKPLTYLSAPVAGGAASTLDLRVGGVRWHEAPSHYPLRPRDRSYVLRHDDEGNTSVIAGDGSRGARFPTGAENVVARYRVGTGLAGLVGPDQITLLATRPLGIKEVTNPIESSGAEDPERRDAARRNAPLTVLTLDRIVSLRDFEDFARAFAGIGKARADWVWDGSRQVIYVTVAGANGGVVADDVLRTLREAMDRARDPYQQVVLSKHQALQMTVEARLKSDPNRDRAAVEADVRTALRQAFSFEAREFAQGVAFSDVVAVIQGVGGVVAVAIDLLQEVLGSARSNPTGLIALPARWEPIGRKLRPAQLLTLATENNEPVRLLELS